MTLYVCRACEPHDGTVCTQRVREGILPHFCPCDPEGECIFPEWKRIETLLGVVAP